MGKRYSLNFKKSALKYYHDLTAVGEVTVNKTTVTNIRDLCEILEISSYSLYKWEKEISNDDDDNNEGELDTGDSIEIPKPKQNEIKLALEGFELIDDFFAGDVDDQLKSIESQINVIVEEKLKSEMRNRALSIRKLASQARDLGIQNYSRMTLAQLKLQIGNELIKSSGLIRNKKRGNVK